MRAVIIYKILFIIFSLVLLAPFVIVPTMSMMICLELTVFNPTPPPTELNDYILWKMAREKMCDWPGDFIPAIILAAIDYVLYIWFFTVRPQKNKEKFEIWRPDK